MVKKLDWEIFPLLNICKIIKQLGYYYKKGMKFIMSSFVIKLIAIVTMLCDHSGDAILGHFSILNVIGRIAFPLFCFQIVIGYKHTKNVKKYLSRLFIFGLISQIPFSLFTYSYLGRLDLLNVYFTLALGLLAVYILDTFPKKYKIIAIGLGIILMVIAELAQTDYGWFGVCLIICIYLFYNDKNATQKTEAIVISSGSNNIASDTISSKNVAPQAIRQKSENAITYFNNNILFTIVLFALILIKFSNYFSMGSYYTYLGLVQIIGTFFPIIFMLLYNGKKGPSMKYAFYVFYPVHLLILVAIHYMI